MDVEIGQAERGVMAGKEFPYPQSFYTTNAAVCTQCTTIPCICFQPTNQMVDYASVFQRIAEALEDIAEKLESKEV